MVENPFSNPSMAKVETIMQKQEIHGKANVKEAVMPIEKIFNVIEWDEDRKVKWREAGYASTTKRSREQLREVAKLKVKSKGKERKCSKSREEKITH